MATYWVSFIAYLELSYSDGTTNGVNDFGSISDLQFVTIVVSAQTSMHNFSIPIIDDAIVEASERFEVSLLNVDVLSSHLQSDVTVTMTNGMTTTDIIIQDDDTGRTNQQNLSNIPSPILTACTLCMHNRAT